MVRFLIPADVRISTWVLLAVTFSAAMVPLAGFGKTGNGDDSTTSRRIKKFDAIEVKGEFKVTTDPKARFDLVLQGDSNLHDCVLTRVREKTLQIKWNHTGCRPNRGITVTVQHSQIDTLRAAGAARIEMNGLKAKSLDLTALGASQIGLEVELEELRIRSSGAALVSLAGKVSKGLSIQSEGASKVQAETLQTPAARVETSGVARVRLGKVANMKIEASGVSRVFYQQTPKTLSKQVTGSAKIGKALADSD